VGRERQANLAIQIAEGYQRKEIRTEGGKPKARTGSSSPLAGGLTGAIITHWGGLRHDTATCRGRWHGAQKKEHR